MQRGTIKLQGCDLYIYPEPHTRLHLGSDMQITKGDLHGNAINLLHYLLLHDVVDFKTTIEKDGVAIEIDTIETAFGEKGRDFIIETYKQRLIDQKFDISTLKKEEQIAHIKNSLAKEQYDKLCTIYQKKVNELTQEDINEYQQLLNNLRIKRTDLHIRLIGDVLADRGKSDHYTLLIYQLLNNHNIKLETIFSNHDLSFYLAFVNDFARAREGEHLRLDGQQGASYEGMMTLINKNLISKEKMVTIVKNIYLPSLRIVSYICNKQEDEINTTFVPISHAPNDLSLIKSLAEHYGIAYSDETSDDLMHIVDKINAYAQYELQNDLFHLHEDFDRKLHEMLYVPGGPGKAPPINVANHPLFAASWNRQQEDKTDQFIDVTPKGKFTIPKFLHGHEGDSSIKSYNFFENLDATNLGKFIPKHRIESKLKEIKNGIIKEEIQRRVLTPDIEKKIRDSLESGSEAPSNEINGIASEIKDLITNDTEYQKYAGYKENIGTLITDISQGLTTPDSNPEPISEDQMARMYSFKNCYHEYLRLQEKIQSELSNEAKHTLQEKSDLMLRIAKKSFNLRKGYDEYSKVKSNPEVTFACQDRIDKMQNIITNLNHAFLVDDAEKAFMDFFELAKLLYDDHQGIALPNRLIFILAELSQHLDKSILNSPMMLAFNKISADLENSYLSKAILFIQEQCRITVPKESHQPNVMQQREGDCFHEKYIGTLGNFIFQSVSNNVPIGDLTSDNNVIAEMKQCIFNDIDSARSLNLSMTRHFYENTLNAYTNSEIASDVIFKEEYERRIKALSSNAQDYNMSKKKPTVPGSKFFPGFEKLAKINENQAEINRNRREISSAEKTDNARNTNPTFSRIREVNNQFLPQLQELERKRIHREMLAELKKDPSTLKFSKDGRTLDVRSIQNNVKKQLDYLFALSILEYVKNSIENDEFRVIGSEWFGRGKTISFRQNGKEVTKKVPNHAYFLHKDCVDGLRNPEDQETVIRKYMSLIDTCKQTGFNLFRQNNAKSLYAEIANLGKSHDIQPATYKGQRHAKIFKKS